MATEMIPYSRAWYEARKTHIGSSDAPVIMGVGRKTPYRLWMEKLGYVTNEVTAPMQRGTQMEPVALKAYCERVGCDLKPQVWFGSELWAMVTLDGLSESLDHAVEIKMAGKDDHAVACEGKVPDHYWPQVQYQLAVLDIDEMNYFSVPHFSQDCRDGVVVEVKRDHAYIDGLMRKCEEFWENLMNEEAPSLSSKDYKVRDDWDWNALAHEANQLLQEKRAIEEGRLKEIEKKLASIKGQLIEISQEHSCVGGGVKLRKTLRKGQLDPELLKDELLDLNRYRKAASWVWTLSADSVG